MNNTAELSKHTTYTAGGDILPYKRNSELTHSPLSTLLSLWTNLRAEFGEFFPERPKKGQTFNNLNTYTFALYNR